MVTFIRIFLLLSFFLFLPSCLSKKNPPIQTKKQILRTCLNSDILSLDPRKHTNANNHGVVRSLFAGLMYLDNDLTPQLDLAKSYTVSDDFKKYTFHLRDSKWSDGSAITAKDFEESWKSLLNPAFVSRLTNPLRFFKNGDKAFFKECSVEEIGVCALDDKTLVVELEKPNCNFLDITSFMMFCPVHTTIRSSEIENVGSVITSGPFSLKNYTPQNKVVLEKNRYFWDAPNIFLEEVEFFIIKNRQTALFMFENKELDFFSEVTAGIVPHAISSLKKQKLFQEIDAAGVIYLLLNTQKFPLTNINIRKALAYAIDRKSLMENILYMDSSTPTLGIIPKVIKKDRWHPFFQDHDVEKAKAYFAKGLEELKITKEEFPPITIIYSSSSAVPSVLMEVVQQMWECTLGCPVNCQGFESGIFSNHLKTKTYDIGRLGFVIGYNDPAQFLGQFTSKNSKTGYTGWSSEEYNQEVIAAQESGTMDKRWEHIENAERIFFEYMPAIPLTNLTASYVKHPYVKGVEVNALFLLNLRRTYIE